MRAKWLWTRWAHLALAVVVVLEVTWLTFAALWLVPRFQKLVPCTGDGEEPKLATAGTPVKEAEHRQRIATDKPRLPGHRLHGFAFREMGIIAGKVPSPSRSDNALNGVIAIRLLPLIGQTI